jgi:nodulation protein E
VPRVVITGVGVISPIGLTRDAFWRSLVAGTCGIRTIHNSDFDQIRFKHAADIEGFVPEDHLAAKDISLMDRFAQFAVVAAKEAMAQSGLELTPAMREDGAVVTGSCIGGRSAEEIGYRELYIHGRNRVHPLTIPLGMANAGASHISMQFGIQGPSYTISTACASSAHSIGQAFHMVRSGTAPFALAGGSEAPLYFGNLKAWEAMRVISKDTCRPFSADRSGLVLGEGAAMLVLEPLEAALARGAKPIAEIVGFGMSADASHITNPSVEGAATAMRKALADANASPEQVGYINAHGTGTQANDATESAAIHQVFGPHAPRIPISSTKALHGHAIGASGALEALATVLALQEQRLPHIAGVTTPDTTLNVDVITNTPRPADATRPIAISNSLAFGGLNAVIALRRYS